MAAEFERLSKLEYWKWKKDSEHWSTMLAELRTTTLMTQLQVNTRSARAKELMTSGYKDSLVTVMTVLEDLCDLEATVIDTYVTALKVSSDPETLALIEAETTASKEFATTTEATIKAATRVVKTVSDKLDEKAAQEQRVSHRAHSQETLSGEHHSNPPNKINVASDLKPEQLCDTISPLNLDDWCERAEVYAEASNIIKQSNSVQLGYLQAIVKPEMWTLYREYCEANLILQTDTDFEKGIELLKETLFSTSLRTASGIVRAEMRSEKLTQILLNTSRTEYNSNYGNLI